LANRCHRDSHSGLRDVGAAAGDKLSLFQQIVDLGDGKNDDIAVSPRLHGSRPHDAAPDRHDMVPGRFLEGRHQKLRIASRNPGEPITLISAALAIPANMTTLAVKQTAKISSPYPSLLLYRARTLSRMGEDCAPYFQAE